MTKAELEAKRNALVAEANSPEHAAHRIQVQLHQDHLRTYLHERQASSEND